MYIFADDATGRAFADLLARKARQGVRVFCVYDAFASRRWAGLGPETEPLKLMRASGVRLEVFHPVGPWECRYAWHPLNRNHRKLFVVDDEVAGMGGLNIGTEYAGAWIVSDATGEFWRDNAVGITGPGVTAVPRRVPDDVELRPRRRAAPPAGVRRPPGRRRRARAAGQRPDGRQRVPPVDQRAAPVGRAERHDDDGLLRPRRRVGEGAVRRGPPGRAGAADVPRRVGRADGPAGRAGVLRRRCCRPGARCTSGRHAVLHAKTLCIDGRTTVIGSANLDYRSIEYNCELSADRPVGRRSAGRSRTCSRTTSRYADPEITRAEWRRLHWWDRFSSQWGVSRARYVLEDGVVHVTGW
jgi:cardiolipin synthase